MMTEGILFESVPNIARQSFKPNFTRFFPIRGGTELNYVFLTLSHLNLDYCIFQFYTGIRGTETQSKSPLETNARFM